MKTRKVLAEDVYDQMSPQNQPPKMATSTQEYGNQKKADGKETSPYVYTRL